MTESRAHAVLAAVLIAWSGQAWTQSETTDRPDLSGVWMAYDSSGGGAGQLSERGQEIVQQVRRVHMDGRAHPDNYPPTAIGHSIGHWDRCWS